MRRLSSLLCVVAVLAALAAPAYAQYQKAQSWCGTGGVIVAVPGTGGSTLAFQQSAPACTITVFDTGTVNLSTLYATSTGTAKANPFTAASSGLFFFYADPVKHYDVVMSGGGLITPVTLSDVAVNPGSGALPASLGTAGQQLTVNSTASGAIWQTKPERNVADFGTVSAATIKLCIAAAHTAGGGVCVLPDNSGSISFTGGVDVFLGTGTSAVALRVGRNTTLSCAQALNVGSTKACIVMRSNTAILGPGPWGGGVIKLADTQGDNHRLIETVGTGVSNVEIARVEIDGNKANQTCGTNQSHGIALNIAVDADVHDNYIHDTCGDAVMEWGTATPSQHLSIRNNRIANAHRAGVSFISETSTEVVDNVITTNDAFNLIHGEADSATQFNQNLVISRNLLAWTGAGFVDVGITLGGQSNSGDNTSSAIISDNILLGGATIRCQRQPYTIIKGNIVQNAFGSGIVAQGRNLIVQGNYVQGNGNGTGALTTQAGIYVDSISANDTYPEPAGTSGNIVDGNFVDGFANIGILVRNSNHASVTNNSVRNIQNNSGGALGFGIDVNGDSEITGAQSTGNVVANNRVWDNQTIPTLQKGIVIQNTDKAIIVGNSSLNGVVANWDAATNNTNKTVLANPGLANTLVDALTDAAGFLGPLNGIVGGVTPAAITGTTITANTGVVTPSISGTAVSASANHAVCWKTTTTLGYCSDTVGAGGTCTCN